MLDLKLGDLVLAWPGAFYPSCSESRTCSERGWHIAQFVRTNDASSQKGHIVLYGVSIPSHKTSMSEGGKIPWWCDEDKVIPIPKGATSVQIEALRIMYGKV